MIEIVHEQIDINAVLKSVADPAAGAIDVFIGITRNNAEGNNVRYLEYEAYEPMALKEIQTLVETAKQRWNLCQVAIVHRLGRVDIGEASVVIAVSSPHRKESFEACRFLIDLLKEKVPIWKKEYFEENGAWVHNRKSKN